MPSLETILHAQSPRFTPRPIPLVSRLISIFAPLLFVVLTAQAFYRDGIGMWSVGIVYILYDTSLLLFTAWQIRKLVQDVAAPAPSGPRPTLGVIVAAHNEASVIRLTIDRLLAQAEAPEAILIADDGSSDETPAAMLAGYGLAAPALGGPALDGMAETTIGHTRLQWLRLPHGGKARALNQALQRITTDVVLTVDADTLLEPGAIAAMRAAFVRALRAGPRAPPSARRLRERRARSCSRSLSAAA
jgi:cellulose synthase/poly-beta-1,6-N-acetylglucosamine synthase-like glycosyltransferase